MRSDRVLRTRWSGRAADPNGTRADAVFLSVVTSIPSSLSRGHLPRGRILRAPCYSRGSSTPGGVVLGHRACVISAATALLGE